MPVAAMSCQARIRMLAGFVKVADAMLDQGLVQVRSA
jgi:hypothetical protein